MKNISKKQLWLLLAVALLTSCKKDNLDEPVVLTEGPAVSVQVGGEMAQLQNTQKSYLDENVVKWEVGDKILFNNHVMTVFNVTGNGKVAHFRGQATTYNNAGNGTNNWFAVYPHYLAADQSHMLWTDDNGTSYRQQLRIKIPQTQYYQAVDESNQNYLKNMNYMVAYTQTKNADNSVSLKFVNLCAVLKVGLRAGPTDGHGAHLDHATNNPQNGYVKKIVLHTHYGITGSVRIAFWGEGKVTTTAKTSGNANTNDIRKDANGVLNPTNSDANVNVMMQQSFGEYIANKHRILILDCTHELNPETGNAKANVLINDGKGVQLKSDEITWFYIMVPVCLLPSFDAYQGHISNLTLEVYDGNGNMMKKTITMNTLNSVVNRNTVYTSDLGALECQYAASSFIDADFSLGDGPRTIKFTKGNLQYNQSSGEYRFAPHQYTVAGLDNSDPNAWHDLFRCPDNSSNTADMVNITRTSNDPGWNNYISGHPKQLFMLQVSKDFCNMLAARRPHLSTINGVTYNYALGKVDTNGSGGYAYGLIIFPDQLPDPLPSGIISSNTSTLDSAKAYYQLSENGQIIQKSGLNIYAHTTSSTSYQTLGTMKTVPENRLFVCTKDFLEASGCVFLPCAGIKYGDQIVVNGTYYSIRYNGFNSDAAIAQTQCINRVGYYYMGSTKYNIYLGFPFKIQSNTLIPGSTYDRQYNYSSNRSSIFIELRNKGTLQVYKPEMGGSIRLILTNFDARNYPNSGS